MRCLWVRAKHSDSRGKNKETKNEKKEGKFECSRLAICHQQQQQSGDEKYTVFAGVWSVMCAIHACMYVIPVNLCEATIDRSRTAKITFVELRKRWVPSFSQMFIHYLFIIFLLYAFFCIFRHKLLCDIYPLVISSYICANNKSCAMKFCETFARSIY